MNPILVIDSNKAFLAKLAERLDACGLTTSTAACAVEGLKLFREANPSTLVVELFLPDKDGLEVLRDVKRTAPETKVVVLSGSSFFNDYSCLHAARLFGAEATVAKEDDLDATVERVLAVLTTPDALFQEKRKYPRKRVNIPALVSTNGQRIDLSGRLLDLSLQGALLRVDKSHPKASCLKDQEIVVLMLGRSREWKNAYRCSPCRLVETPDEIQLGLTFHPLDERRLKELACYL